MKKIKINVLGMHCGSCEMLVTDELTDQEGVMLASASFKDKHVICEFDEKTGNN